MKWDNVDKKYDEVIDDYEFFMRTAGYNDDFLIMEKVKELVTDTTAKVLDFGCGTGFIAERLIENKYSEVDGLDASSKMLEKADEKKILKKSYLHMVGRDKLNTELLNKYDLIVSGGALGENHIPKEGIQECIDMINPESKYRYLIFSIRVECMKFGFEEIFENNKQLKLVSMKEFKKFSNMEKSVLNDHEKIKTLIARLYVFQVNK